MSDKFPIGKPRFPSWGLPLLAVVLSLLVHALWLISPQKQPELQPKPQIVRLYAYPNLDTRVWSPTLFSLPSSLGFSGAIRQNTSNVLPPLKSPVRISHPTPLQIEAMFPDTGIQREPSLRNRLPVTVQPMERTPAAKDLVYAWKLDTPDHPDILLELNRAPGIPPSEGPVVITGTLVFDPGGQVQSMMLDPPVLYPGLRPQVIRSLRRVRRLNGSDTQRIRFRFAYVPAEENP